MKNFFSRLMNKDKKKSFMFTTRNLAQSTGNGDRIANPQGSASSGLGQFITVESITSGTTTSSQSGAQIWLPSEYATVSSDTSSSSKKDERIAVEPKAVFEEVKKEGLEPDFSNLDEKIKVVEERIKVLSEHLDESHLKDEHKTLFFLKNRRAYLKTKKKMPLDWAMTNREAVDDLCKRYKLQTVPLKQYYTLVPREGIKEMERYTKVYKAITGDTPIFELVIKDAEVKKEEKTERTKKDRDPILLANSPLGDFMFVIGAWDEEVEVVDEIIYYGK